MKNFIVLTDTQDREVGIPINDIIKFKSWPGEIWKSIVFIKGQNDLQVQETVSEIKKKIDKENKMPKMGLPVFKSVKDKKDVSIIMANVEYFIGHEKYQNVTTFYFVDGKTMDVYGSFKEVCEVLKS